MREVFCQYGGVVVPTAMYHNDPFKETRVKTGVVVRGMWAMKKNRPGSGALSGE